MHGDQLRTRVFHVFYKLQCFSWLFPPQPNLHRQRHRNRGFHLFHNLHSAISLFHQASTIKVADNLIHWTSHVDINAIWVVALFHNSRSFCHGIWICTKNLLNNWTFLSVKINHAQGSIIPSHQRLRRHHFSKHNWRFKLFCHQTKRTVCHVSHWRQSQNRTVLRFPSKIAFFFIVTFVHKKIPECGQYTWNYRFCRVP